MNGERKEAGRVGAKRRRAAPAWRPRLQTDPLETVLAPLGRVLGHTLVPLQTERR